MGVTGEFNIWQTLKDLRKDQERQHKELCDLIDTNTKWLARIAEILERQTPVQAGVYHQAGAPQR